MRRIRSTLPRAIFEIQSEVREQMETRNTGTKLTTIRQVLDDGGRGGNAHVSDVYVIFDANQAKSSIDNTGAFSQTDNDIRFRPARRVPLSNPGVSEETRKNIAVGEQANWEAHEVKTKPMSSKPQLVDYGLTEDDVLEIRSFNKTAATSNDIPGTQWLENILSVICKHGCLGELVGGILVWTVLWPFFLIPLLLSPITSHFVKPATKPIHPKKQKLDQYRAALDQYSAAVEELNRLQQSFWRALSGVQFENEVAALLRKHGHDVQTTPYSGDEGVDLIMDRDIIIQCKAHAKPVSPATVRELLGSKQCFKARKAILIASCGCTSGATAFAKKTDIDLWDISHLIELQEKLNGKNIWKKT